MADMWGCLPRDPPLGTALLGDGSDLLLEVGGGCVVRMIAVARPDGLSKASQPGSSSSWPSVSLML